MEYTVRKGRKIFLICKSETDSDTQFDIGHSFWLWARRFWVGFLIRGFNCFYLFPRSCNIGIMLQNLDGKWGVLYAGYSVKLKKYRVLCLLQMKYRWKVLYKYIFEKNMLNLNLNLNILLFPFFLDQIKRDAMYSDKKI